MCGPDLDTQITEALKRLDDKYREAAEALLTSLKDAKTVEQKKDAFNQFAEKYTVIPPLRNKFIESFEDAETELDVTSLPAFFDFYLDYFVYRTDNTINIQGLQNYFTQFSYWTTFFSEITDKETYFFFNKYAEEHLKDRPFAIKFFEELITFPHHDLEKAYKKLEQYSDRPISKELMEKYVAAKEYVKKWNAKEDEYDWMEHTFEFGLKYAIQCYESLLNNMYTDAGFWKKYIAALKSQNVKAALQVMLKYIRLFVDDTEMKEIYEKELSEAKNIPGYDDLPDLQFYLAAETFTTDSRSKLDVNYFTNSKNLQEQNLPIKLSLVDYLIENGDSPFLQKLQKTCRIFSSQKAIPICHQLILSHRIKSSRYETQTLKIKILKNMDNVASEEIESKLFETPAGIFDNLYISNRLYIKSDIPCYAKFIIAKIYKCDARFLELDSQKLTWIEFDFLTSSKKLKNLVFDYTNVYEDEQNIAPLEDVVEKLSHVSSIEISGYSNITPKTCENLALLDIKCKFDFCGLGNFVAENFNIEEYAKFIEKHVKQKSVFEIYFLLDLAKWSSTLQPVVRNAREQLELKFKDQLDPEPRNQFFCNGITLDFA